jgi:HSP20 family molecular chaperone IbpA
MASIESVIKEVAELLGHDENKIDITLKGGKMVITIEDIDEDDFDDADDDFEDDDA